MNFKFIKSFPSSFIINPIGVTTKKKITPIIIGEIIFPNRIPNLNQSLFNGDKRLEFKTPKTKNIKVIKKIKDKFFNLKNGINKWSYC